eukprot:1187278-Prorocentrum_minimum.AAC.2
MLSAPLPLLAQKDPYNDFVGHLGGVQHLGEVRLVKVREELPEGHQLIGRAASVSGRHKVRAQHVHQLARGGLGGVVVPLARGGAQGAKHQSRLALHLQ